MRNEKMGVNSSNLSKDEKTSRTQIKIIEKYYTRVHHDNEFELMIDERKVTFEQSKIFR